LARPLSSDFKTSLLCWGGFIVLLSFYCMLYQVVVDRAPADLGGSFSHAFKNWGVWLLTTPVIFAALRSYSTKWHDRAVEFVALVAVVVFMSTSVPVAIDLLTNARDAATSLMIFLPRYVVVVGVVYLIWARHRAGHGTAQGGTGAGAVTGNRPSPFSVGRRSGDRHRAVRLVRRRSGAAVR
jgi:hypothetical protein